MDYEAVAEFSSTLSCNSNNTQQSLIPNLTTVKLHLSKTEFKKDF